MNIALQLSYHGSDCHGWQRQCCAASVQENIEQALSQVAQQAVTVNCAGRTDAGVHATAQVVNFETDADRPLKAWVLGGNALLPKSIRVNWARPVSDGFHARFSAMARRYHYIVDDHSVRSPHMQGLVTWHGYQLDAALMHEAAQCLLGEQDFSSVRAAGCQSKTAMRCVDFCHVARIGRFIVVDIQANAFLHHMVRNIVGTLLPIGAGQEPVDWLQQVLRSKNRQAAGVTAPPDGLYLVDVIYPLQFDLPRNEVGVDWLSTPL